MKINLTRLRNMLTPIARSQALAEHGNWAWHKMLQHELVRLDQELRPAQDRVQKLSAARNALLHEMAMVVNGTEDGGDAHGT